MKITEAKEVFYYEYKIKNSKFCCYLLKVHNKENIDQALKKYNDHKASHQCYAYIVEENGKVEAKGFDDREPRNTAGAAMLYVLQKQKLSNILIINVRYFRPPQLGASNLMKAYQRGVIELLKKYKQNL